MTQSDQIGTSGDNGNSSGPHLHFEVRNQNRLPADPYGWLSTKPDPYFRDYSVQSVKLWVTNPSVTAPVNYGAFIIEDTVANSTTFKKWCTADNSGANCPYWYGVNVGSDGHMFYTLANGTTTDYRAQWTPGAMIPSSGRYEVKVYIPNAYATSGATRYKVFYSGGSRTVVVDQCGVPGKWVSLGSYMFLKDGTNYIRVLDSAFISDYTDSTSNMIGVDAVKFIRRSP